MYRLKKLLRSNITAYMAYYVTVIIVVILVSLAVMTVSIFNMSGQRAYSYQNYAIDDIFANYAKEDMRYALEQTNDLVISIEFLNEKKQVKDSAGSEKTFGYQYSEREFNKILRNDREYIVYFPFSDRDDAFIVHAPKLAGPRGMLDIVVYHLVGFFMLLAMMLVLLMYQLRYKLVMPILELKQAVEQIERENYEFIIEFESENELSVLKNSILHMGRTIQNQLIQLRGAEEERKRMILSLSHDIRTPMTNISGYSESLKKGFYTTDDERIQAIDVIYNNTQRANALINGLFDYAKFDSEQLSIKKTPQDLVQCLKESLISFYPDFEAKSIRLDIQVPSKPVITALDRLLFDRLISNLLTNSLRYGNSGGRFKVELVEGAEHIKITLQDEGPGIPDDIKYTLFDPFVTGDEARSHRSGTGLGLTIARRLAQRLDGKLEWDETYKKGVRWRIILNRTQSVFVSESEMA